MHTFQNKQPIQGPRPKPRQPLLQPKPSSVDKTLKETSNAKMSSHSPLAVHNNDSYIGEVTTKGGKIYPILKDGQWYDDDRKYRSTNSTSTFWKASKHNLENGKAYLYKTVAQRHAFYKFADAYLKSKNIVS